MNAITFIGLVNNAALLLALGLLYDTIALDRKSEKLRAQMLTGVLLGAIGVAVMLNPWEFTPGLIFDTRSVLLSVGGLFFGSIPTLVAVLMTGAYRLYLGGTGVWMGVAVIVTSGLIGAAWRHMRRKELATISLRELYILGIVVHVAMLLCVGLLPWSDALAVFPKISLPVMIVYPAGTVLLGKLMAARVERKRVEQQLTFQATLLDQVQDMVTAMDLDGLITYVNEAQCHAFGKTADELIGQPIGQYGDAPGRTAMRSLATGSALGDERRRGEVVTFTGDGREIILDSRTQFVYDESGEPVAMLGVSTDITERVHAEALLRESEARYRGLFDNSPISLWEEDFSKVKRLLDGLALPEGTDLRTYLESRPDIVSDCARLVDICDINKATMDLFEAGSKDEILGSLDRLFIDESLTTFREEICSLHEGMAAFETEIVGRSVMGHRIDCVTNVSVAPGHGESWARVLVSVTDITERKRSEEALRESKRRLEETLAELRQAQEHMMQQERLAAVGQLSAGIAHDFNNILASIVLYTQMSLRMNDLTPQIRTRLEVIADQADHAADLVQQILDFGRRAVIERRPLALDTFLKDVLRLLVRTLPESIQVAVSSEPGNHMINADPTRVQQAIVNLALNARDAMPGGGEIHLALSRVEDGDFICAGCGQVAGGAWVRLQVRDSGAGIPPDVLPHIFEPFFTTRAPLGHGLGLAQVYGIIKQHEGHISVEAEVGQGTTFSLYWPAVAADQLHTPAPAESEAPRGAGQTILVVEDNATIRVALAEVMALLGYRVLEATNGREALAAFEQHQNDIALVLSDWVMPSMGGLELVRALMARHTAVKVLMLTGHPLDEETKGSVPESVVGWVMKPPSLEQLAAAVARALAQPESVSPA